MDSHLDIRGKRWQQSIERFLRDRLVFRLGGVEAQMSAVAKKRAALTERRHTSLVAITEFEERIASTIASLDEQALAEMFETLLAMEGIRKVHVQGACIVIDTHVIEQENGNGTFDIGQFHIRIELGPQGLSRRIHIRFILGTYSGLYEHAYAKETGETCFGPNLNDSIQKFLDDMDLLPLVHILLSFLRHESTKPIERSAVSDAGPDESGYASETEREEEKAKFVALVKSALIPRQTGWLQKQLQHEKNFFDHATKVWLGLRKGLQAMSMEIELLNRQIDGVSITATGETTRLLDIAGELDITGLEYADETLSVTFLVKKLPLTLTASKGGIFRLHGVPNVHPLRDLVDTYDNLDLDSEDERMLATEFRKGPASFAIAAIKFVKKQPTPKKGGHGGYLP